MSCLLCGLMMCSYCTGLGTTRNEKRLMSKLTRALLFKTLNNKGETFMITTQ